MLGGVGSGADITLRGDLVADATADGGENLTVFAGAGGLDLGTSGGGNDIGGGGLNERFGAVRIDQQFPFTVSNGKTGTVVLDISWL